MLYESDGNTKKSLIVNLVALVNKCIELKGLLFILLFYSIVGSDDKWTCEIESANNSNIYYLYQNRRSLYLCWDEKNNEL